MPTVSVVIPTKDRLPFLREALTSVEAQTFRDLEVIVVDDAGTDGTPAWLAQQARRGLVHVRLDAASERSTARNRGLDIARGEFVIFLDDDDRLLPNAVERLVSGLRRHPRAAAAVGAFVMFDSSGHRRRIPHPRRVMERSAWHDALFYWAATPGRVLFKTNVVRAIGGFRTDPPPGFEDWDLWLRITHRNRVLLIPAPVLEYRIHGGQKTDQNRQRVIDVLAGEFASSLGEHEARAAETINRARALFQEGSLALTELDPRRAIRCFAAAIKIRPVLLTSPVTRPLLLGSVMKASVGLVLGRRGTRASRRIRKTIRRRLRRDVWPARPTGSGRED